MASKYQGNSVLTITGRKIAQNVTNYILVSNYVIYVFLRNNLSRPCISLRIFGGGAGII
jgi:hypothetical protein